MVFPNALWNVKDNIPGHLLAQIRKELDDGD